MPAKLVEMLYEGDEKHRCMNGRSVKIGSKACVNDLEKRIHDAVTTRDSCDLRSDARLHYNGLLKILRRKLRQSIKVGDHA
jgi:hypothetical protein